VNESSSPSHFPQTAPPETAATPQESDEDLLVAYLDGELNAGEARMVEERLGRDPVFREKMASLEQTWNMLSVLEVIPVDKTLVKSTMEMLVLDVEKEVRETEKIQEKRKIPNLFFMVATFLLIGLIGFQVASLVGIRMIDTFIRDIPIIEKLDQYRQIDDFRFLQSLAESGVFDDERGTP